MDVRGKSFKGIELNLLDDEAHELHHIVTIWLIGAKRGDHGSGTSVDESIKFAEDLTAAMSKRLDKTGATELVYSSESRKKGDT